jgi:hypothetical protein
MIICCMLKVQDTKVEGIKKNYFTSKMLQQQASVGTHTLSNTMEN